MVHRLAGARCLGLKRVIVGILLSVVIFGGYEALASFPSFIASAVWSSDLTPDPDFIDEVDADFLAASPELIIADEETVDAVVPEEVPVEMIPEEESAEEVQADVIHEEEPLVVTQPEIEEQVIATPDAVVVDEVIDEGVIATPDEAVEDEVVMNTEGAIQ